MVFKFINNFVSREEHVIDSQRSPATSPLIDQVKLYVKSFFCKRLRNLYSQIHLVDGADIEQARDVHNKLVVWEIWYGVDRSKICEVPLHTLKKKMLDNYFFY